MALTLADAIVNITGDDSKLDGVFGRAKKKTTGFVSGLGSAIKGGLTKGVMAGAAVVTAAVVGLGFAFRDATALAREQRDAERQLDAVLQSMGGNFGLTAEQIKGMASELQGVTNFGDEAIISGQNLLLTFGNIGSDIFPRVTETMLDMSQALGQDMKSSAIQLGKALNDPVQGVSALSRVGVSFTEEQKEQIRVMAESGDVMGAQQVILGELEKQFGGSAKSLADPAIQARNAWGDFKEMIGGVLLTIQGEFAKRAMPLLQGLMEGAQPVVEGISTAIERFAERLDLGLSPARALAGVLPGLFESLGFGRDRARELADQVMGIVTWFQQAWATVQEFGAQLMEALAPVFEAIAGFVSWKDVLITLGIAIAATVLPIIGTLLGAILSVVAPVLVVIGIVAALRNAWENNFLGIQEKTRAVIEFVRNLITTVMTGIQAFWAANGDAILAKAQEIWQTIQQVVTTVIQTVQAILAAVTGAIRSSWDEHGASIQASAQRFWEAVKAFIQNTIETVRNIIETVASAIQAFWEAHGEAILAGAQAAWETIQEVIDMAMERIRILFDVFAAIFEGDWDAFLASIQELWQNSWDIILGVVEAFWEFLSPIIEGIVTEVKEALQPTIEALQGKFEDVFGAISSAIQPVYDLWLGFKGAVEEFWSWLKGKKFDFSINLPSLPDWATPGSPLPIHTAWKDFAGWMDGQRSVARAVGAMQGAGGTTNVTHNYNLTANYRYQDRESLAADVRVMEMLRGRG